MTRSSLNDNAAQRIPTLEELVASVKKARLVPTAIDSAALETLAELLRSHLLNGGVILETFVVEGADDAATWLFARNHFNTYGMLEKILSEAATQTASALGDFDAPAAAATFRTTDVLTLDGELARTVVRGGAYMRFDGTFDEAKRLGLQVCKEMFGDAWIDIRVDQSSAPWSSWFYDVAWDNTWVITNTRTRQVTLLCQTDTD